MFPQPWLHVVIWFPLLKWRLRPVYFHKHRSGHETFHINKRAVNYFLDFSFLCRPIWGNATVSAFPHVLIVGGGMAFLQQNIWGNGVPPRSPSTTPLICWQHWLLFFATACLSCSLSVTRRFILGLHLFLCLLPTLVTWVLDVLACASSVSLECAALIIDSMNCLSKVACMGTCSWYRRSSLCSDCLLYKTYGSVQLLQFYCWML